ncbi:zinc finger CCCH-type with G patch domain-containing protein [Conger conger]|uniref:zinc finger CCCH-type with G patch domain-containing protein n=1 Tax=Conger conger TaxID=82655 RepID=UPI002A5AF5F1|nr:zinc finger CCCH-type with G patch domain-containing protein [Conger conger]XP_061114148.1 zinc finger CCCH-type with G patch domain-containing protein [Conger conger]
MDEGSLEAAIETYNAQLQQVETALGAGLDPSQQSDLLKLKEDLRQLIELTESSLVSVKKSRLLASLEDSTAEGEPAGAGLDDQFSAFYSELGETPPEDSPAGAVDCPQGSERTLTDEAEEDGEEEEDEDAVSGMKVRAPYHSAWGTLEYHNAMVVGAEDPDGAEARVRVLYIHPTHKSMKPCPFFLEDKCRFMENCRFSHGEVVAVSELRQFQDLDLSNLQEGSACLARHEDGIWYPAKITDIEEGYYTVKFNSLLQRSTIVEADGIIPPLRQDDPSSSESDGDDDFGEYSAYAKVLDSVETGEWAPSCSSSFAGWEAHTRGIGSKLMLKMGYEFGKGLGRSLEGRVEPVTAVVLPKGRSLDQCAEMNQKQGRKRQGKGEGSKARRKGKRAGGARRGRSDVFDFLNSKLGDREADGQANAPPPNSKDAYRGGESAKRSLNVRLFQATERVVQTEREIERLNQALARQAGRDKTMATHLEERLAAARSQLVQLKAQELRVQQDQRKANTHKKMTEF